MPATADDSHDRRLERRHDRRLERGRRWWDLVSGATERTGYDDQMLDAALPDLDLRPGHTVVDIGCGPGKTFERLREAVTPGGRVIGIDYSPASLALAERRIRRHGWTDVEVRRADFTRPTLAPESADRAIAFSSLSAMPDVPAAVGNAHDQLRPGGRLWVFDMRIKPAGLATPLIWAIDGVYRAVAGYAGVDVLDTARARFARVETPDIPPRTGAPPRPQSDSGWPPFTAFVAHRAG